MAKKVLIISTSLRGGSNSEILANECAKGAKEAGHDVELLSLKGKDIKYCIGCLSCQRTGMCVQKDDIADIMAKVKNAEVVHGWSGASVHRSDQWHVCRKQKWWLQVCGTCYTGRLQSFLIENIAFFCYIYKTRKRLDSCGGLYGL